MSHDGGAGYTCLKPTRDLCGLGSCSGLYRPGWVSLAVGNGENKQIPLGSEMLLVIRIVGVCLLISQAGLQHRNTFGNTMPLQE